MCGVRGRSAVSLHGPQSSDVRQTRARHGFKNTGPHISAVQLGSDPLNELSIPDGTTVEEHDLVTDGDVVVGGQSDVEFGVRGRNVIAGERATFGGHIEAEGDLRLDMWTDVADNVLVGNDAYLGERVHIDGQLRVAGDLDIGDDVNVEEGFEANGWIVIRNPMPSIVFLFIYLSQLLRIGEEEAAERLLSELTDEAAPTDPLLIPRGSHVSDDAWRVSTPATVGDDCRIHGNVRAESLSVGRDNVVFGSLRARADVTIAHGTVIKGDVTTRNGDVAIGPDAEVWGDISGTNVAVHEDATIEGTARASGEIEFVDGDPPDAVAAIVAESDDPRTPESERAAPLGTDEDPESSDPTNGAETDEATDDSLDVAVVPGNGGGSVDDHRTNGHDEADSVAETE